tara:strand:+ start:1157 stop:1522 length:366 start_codon:yes stop_codon:yes gene_type:complete
MSADEPNQSKHKAQNIAQCGRTIPPSSFPKSSIAFSKTKQDVWIRLVQAMDGQQEPVRYKSNVLFGSENVPVSVSLPPFFSDKRKACRRQGENTDRKYQTDWISADESNSFKVKVWTRERE